MRIWTSEHVFDHPWSTVVHAAYRKYPNPMNGAVTGIDVVRQNYDQGKLQTERIIQSRFSIPTWATKLTGFSGTQYSHECTEIDPSASTMKLTTRNLNGMNFLRVDENLTYTPHPVDASRTILKQEAVVVMNLPAFTDYCEKAFINVYQTNALKGRKGVEWVIEHLREVHELSDKMIARFRSK